MKNLFLEKNFAQKLIIALIVVVLFNFTTPTIANAKKWTAEAVESLGGELLPPIMNLFVTIADTILNALQVNLMANVKILIPAEAEEMVDKDGFWKKVAIGTGFAAVTIGSIYLMLHVPGAGFTALPKMAKVIWTGGTTITAVVAGRNIQSAILDFKGEFEIVQIEYTPFAIFSNKVPMFDVNFFNPKTINPEIYNFKQQLKIKEGETELKQLKDKTEKEGPINRKNLENTINSLDMNNREGVEDLYRLCTFVTEWGFENMNLYSSGRKSFGFL